MPPKISEGLIVSGDRFVADPVAVVNLRTALSSAGLPRPMCLEMEGAAVAQVCDEYGVSFGIVRTISDTADHNSVHDFPRFSREIAGHYSAGILSRFVKKR